MKTKISVNKIWVIFLLLCASLFTAYNVSANTNNIDLFADNVVLETSNCSGCGKCVLIAENIFELNDDGIATIKRQPGNYEEKEAVHSAQLNCPGGCIFTNF